MARLLLDPKKHKDYIFEGCSTCDAKCCSSNIIYSTIYDLKEVSTHFPILFYIVDGKISPVYFFYYGERVGEKCPYLNGTLCSIYDNRPYACRAYPFSFEQGNPCFDDGCPKIIDSKSGGISLLNGKKKLNPYFISNFIGKEFTEQKEETIASTGKFINFCVENNFLVPYVNYYANNPLYLNFKPSLSKELYILHHQRIAVMRMQNKELFLGHEDFLRYIIMINASQKNIETLFALKEAKV